MMMKTHTVAFSLLLFILLMNCSLNPENSILSPFIRPDQTHYEPLCTPETTPNTPTTFPTPGPVTPDPTTVSDTPSPPPDTPEPTTGSDTPSPPLDTPVPTQVTGTPTPVPTASQLEESVIINHLCTDISLIPQEWIDEVKKMLLCLPGESHARGYMYGLELVQAGDSRFAVSVKWFGEPETTAGQYLRATPVYRKAANDWSPICGEIDFWTNDTARTKMKSFLGYMQTNNNPVSAFGFGWCWDMTNNGVDGGIDPVYGTRWAGSSIGGPDGDLQWGIDDGDTSLTGNSVNLYTYINTVIEYTDYEPGTISFFTTGPVDGNQGTENGYQRYLKHEALRGYVAANGGVLFDYADILCWDNGVQYLDSWNGHSFQNGDPDLAPGGTGYDGGQGGCHISIEGCRLIGRALWWMLARVAGWPGP